MNLLESGAVDCDAPEDDPVVAALLDAGDDELQEVMTKMAVSISAAMARALLIIRHASFR